MGINRIVNTDFWNDEKVLDSFSVEDKYFWLYLLTNPQTKQLGIYKLPIKIIAFQTGYDENAIKVLLDRFDKTYNVIKYNFETQEVAILNYLKWSIIRGGKPVEDCIKSDMEKVKDKSLITLVYNHLLESDTTQTITLDNIFKHIEANYIEEAHAVEDVAPIPDEAPTQPPKEPKAKEEKHKYGEFNNVLLTDAEHEKIIAVENGERAIEFLSGYIKMKGYKAKSHYLAMLKWVFDALKEQDLKAAELQKREARLQGAAPTKKQDSSMDLIKKLYNEVG